MAQFTNLRYIITRLDYSNEMGCIIPVTIIDTKRNNRWTWSEVDLAYWDDAKRYLYFDSMALRLEDGGNIGSRNLFVTDFAREVEA